MQSIFLQQQHHDKLIIFFSGFASEPCLFDFKRNEDCDVLLVYDYENLNFDFNLLNSYHKIYLLAWSMGVAVSAKVFAHSTIKFKNSIAVNGSTLPLNKDYGIDKRIFFLTLKTLSDKSMQEFRCKIASEFTNTKVKFTRSLDSLIAELKFLYETFKDEQKMPNFHFDKAILGSKDLIFNYEKLKNAFALTNTTTIVKPYEHYNRTLFNNLLSNLYAWQQN